jgi:hypothetical protein
VIDDYLELTARIDEDPASLTTQELRDALRFIGDEYYWKVIAEEAIRRLESKP